jgi:hypothetical protein
VACVPDTRPADACRARAGGVSRPGRAIGDNDERRDEYARDLLLALDEDIRPPSITTDGGRSILQRLTGAAEINIEHPKHNYLAPHGGRRGMGEVLVRAFGYTVAARYLDNSEEMVRERYSHIEAGELGDVATEALDEIDGKSG